MDSAFDALLLRLSATLLLVGQLLYVVITLLHTGGEANHHPAIFSAYAGSAIWTAVHVAQFACMAIFLSGLGKTSRLSRIRGWIRLCRSSARSPNNQMRLRTSRQSLAAAYMA